MQALEVGENEKPDAVAARLDNDLGTIDWWTPLRRRQPEPPKPRVTDDGLKVPSWWADDETESQRMLAAQGVSL